MDAIRDSITVLEGTKSSFKSKELGNLRGRLARVVEKAGEVQDVN